MIAVLNHFSKECNAAAHVVISRSRFIGKSSCNLVDETPSLLYTKPAWVYVIAQIIFFANLTNSKTIGSHGSAVQHDTNQIPSPKSHEDQHTNNACCSHEEVDWHIIIFYTSPQKRDRAPLSTEITKQQRKLKFTTSERC
jgi:hypothetical protein